MTAKDKWLVFDFDGTLADSFKMAHQVFNNLAERYHYPPVADEDVEKMRKKTATEFFAGLGVPLMKVALVLIQARIDLRRHAADIPPIEGIPEVLPILQQQGYSMGILTSNATENVYTFLQSHGLASFFNFASCSPDLFGKAHHIKALVRKYRLDPSSLIYVADTNADIEAARRARIRVAAVSWGYQAREVLEKHNPTWLLDVPSQLAEL